MRILAAGGRRIGRDGAAAVLALGAPFCWGGLGAPSRMHRFLCLLAFLALGALPLVAEPPKKAPAKKPPEEVKHGVPDAALQEAINKAIDKGAAWLRAQQKPNGAFPPIVHFAQAHFQMGASALIGLALLASGDVPAWRTGKKNAPLETVDRVMEFCKSRDREF